METLRKIITRLRQNIHSALPGQTAPSCIAVEPRLCTESNPMNTTQPGPKDGKAMTLEETVERVAKLAEGNTDTRSGLTVLPLAEVETLLSAARRVVALEGAGGLPPEFRRLMRTWPAPDVVRMHPQSFELILDAAADRNVQAAEVERLRAETWTLGTRVEEAERRVKELEERLQIDPGGSDIVDELTDANAQLQARVKELERELRLQEVPVGVEFIHEGKTLQLLNHDWSGSLSSGPQCKDTISGEIVFLNYLGANMQPVMVKLVGAP